MECTKCGGAIGGGRDGENAIAVRLIGNPFTWEELCRDDGLRHPECVDDPAGLSPDQFQKWAMSTIYTVMECLSAQVHNHNYLVDALNEFHPGTRAAYEQVLLRGKGNEE